MNFTEYLLTIPMLVNLYADQYYQNDRNRSMVDLAHEFNVPQIKVYDFIIVGGTAYGYLEHKFHEETAASNDQHSLTSIQRHSIAVMKPNDHHHKDRAEDFM